MTPAPQKSSERAEKLDEVIAAFLEAEQNDATSDRDAWLQRYPDLADDLHRFFEQHDRLARLAAPLREADPVPDGDATTITDVPQTPTVAASEVPRFFGDYEILEEIARGGMGVVYKARQISLNRIVALKMILAGQFASAHDVARFRSEAETVATLDHPNILPIYEVGEHDGRHFFSMKLIAGGSLSDRVKAVRLTPREAARLVALVARAVHFAHQRGILHRDLKPSNILLDERGEPFVVDFGLAKKMGTDSGLTQSGVIVGTPQFMAPEQAGAHKGLTVAVDVYSLGAILYTLLTGQPPFRGDNIMETLRQVAEHEPASPRSVNAQVPRDLEAICLKCLAKELDRRYHSAQDLADDLERFGRGEWVPVRRVSRMERLVKWARRRPAVAGLLAAVLLVFVCGGLTTYFVVQWDKARLARMQEAEWVLDQMAKTSSPSALAACGQELAKLAEQLGPKEAATVAERVLDRMDKTTDPNILNALAPALRKLAERMKPEESARVCAKAAQPVLDGMDKTTDPNTVSGLAQVVVQLAERLKPEEVAKAAQRVLDQMDKAFAPIALNALASALVQLAERMKPEEAARVCAKAAQQVLDG
ncbi:MAG TPA: serine/threonine-protein kinase, partial [Gemmataceae bacterium]